MERRVDYLESYRIAARALGSLVGGAMPVKQLVARGMSVGKKMFLAGEVSRRESISKQNIENALAAFRAMGYLGVGDGGPQRLKSPHDTVDGVRQIDAKIAAMLP